MFGDSLSLDVKSESGRRPTGLPRRRIENIVNVCVEYSQRLGLLSEERRDHCRRRARLGVARIVLEEAN
jgi:hypothetical protein